MTTGEHSYHHGSLPSTLVTTALRMLDNDGDVDLSLRAVAREAGVSTAAPYRHFADRNELLSAVAAVGYRELLTTLAAKHPEPDDVEALADMAVTYVCFALQRPGLFRTMFTTGCDRMRPERVQAVEAINGYLQGAVQRIINTDDVPSTATGLWAATHGLAFLFLDGKLEAESDVELADQVRAIFRAVLAAHPRK